MTSQHHMKSVFFYFSLSKWKKNSSRKHLLASLICVNIFLPEKKRKGWIYSLYINNTVKKKVEST